MSIEQIENQIKENRKLILEKEIEISNLIECNRKLHVDKDQEIFSMILDYLEIGDIIEFTKGWSWGTLRSGDRIELIKKNKKSVLVKFVYRKNSAKWDRNKVGDIQRIESSVFGDFVLNKTDHIQTMIKRNESLKEILGK